MKSFVKEEMDKILSDNELIALHKQGNVKAFEEIFARYTGLVKSICRSYYLLGGDFDDLLQEGFFGLVKAVNTFDEERQASFKTFAYLCVSSNVKTAVKKACSKANMVLTLAVPIHTLIGLQTENLEDEIIQSEGEGELEEKLKKLLSSFERKILKLWLGGLSYSEISTQTGKPVKSVDNAIQRIKKKLANL